MSLGNHSVSSNCAIPTHPNTAVSHPGQILVKHFMEPCNLSPTRLANEIRVDLHRIQEIVNCRRGVSPETALRLARYFNTVPEFWLDLQTDYELACARTKWMEIVSREVTPRTSGSTQITSYSCRQYYFMQPRVNGVTDKTTIEKTSESVAGWAPTEIRIKDDNQRRVYKIIRENPGAHFDLLWSLSSLRDSQVLSALCLLELDGLVVRSAGDTYRVVEHYILVEGIEETLNVENQDRKQEPSSESDSVQPQSQGIQNVVGLAPSQQISSSFLEVTSHVPDQETDCTDGA